MRAWVTAVNDKGEELYGLARIRTITKDYRSLKALLRYGVDRLPRGLYRLELVNDHIYAEPYQVLTHRVTAGNHEAS
jgi:hypothetical protein